MEFPQNFGITMHCILIEFRTDGIDSVFAALKTRRHGACYHWSRKCGRRYPGKFPFRLEGGNVRADIVERINAMFGNVVGRPLTFAEPTA